MFFGVTIGMAIGHRLLAGLFGAAVAWGSHDGYDTEAWSFEITVWRIARVPERVVRS